MPKTLKSAVLFRHGVGRGAEMRLYSEAFRGSTATSSRPTFTGPTRPVTWKEAARRLRLGSGPALAMRARRASPDDPVAMLFQFRIPRGKTTSCREDVVEWLAAVFDQTRREVRENATAIRAERAPKVTARLLGSVH